jgi:hypothetical protein
VPVSQAQIASVPAGGAAQQSVERILATVAAVSRIAALALPVGGIAAGLIDLRHPGLVLLLGIVVVDSVVVAVWCLRSGVVPGRLAVVDALLIAAMMWLGDQPWLSGDPKPWRGLYGFAIVAVVVYGLPRWPLAVATTGPALLSVANLGGWLADASYYPLWNAVLDGLTFFGNMTAVWVIARLMRGSARSLDEYRMTTLRRAQALASERERACQNTALRAGLLSTLEDLAAMELDPALAEQVRQEVRWLRQLAESDTPASPAAGAGGLAAGVRALVAQRITGGLRIQLELSEVLPTVGRSQTEALLGALGEALTNVAKHAGTTQASVRVGGGGGLELVIEDSGRGYDPARVPAGTGQRCSIIERVAEVGGVAAIDSAPGRGTRVRLWVPTGPVPP